MNNLLALPSSKEDDALVSLADWVELSAYFSDKKSASKEELRLALRRMPATDDEPRQLSENNAEVTAGDVFHELQDRVASCASEETGKPTYPFALDHSGSLLRLSQPYDSDAHLLYLFLLGLSVASMSSQQRRRASHDPTKLFERLCADVLRNFWGGASKHSGVMIFGTAATTVAGERKFKANIDALCTALGEGVGWNPKATAPGGGDGSLDLVAWRRFRDKREGGLVGFAQCKTGTHWRDHLTEMVPSAFSRDFMQTQLVLDPLRLYMVPTRISKHRWIGSTGKAGLLIDRCRIVQYGDGLPAKLLAECKAWLDSLFAEQSTLMGVLTK